MDDWWTSFFAGNWLQVQRNAYTDEQTRGQAEVVMARLGLEPGMKALDVPCGTGRIAFELIEAGIAVTGVDGTAALLEDARRTAAERGLALELRHADMRDLPWREEFDAAYCWWGSFGYLDDAGDAEFLRAIVRTLKPGGRFLIDTHVAESLYPKFQPRGWSETGGCLVVEERTMDIENGRIDDSWRIFNGTDWDSRRSSIRIYTYRELRELFLAAGFATAEGFTGKTDTPFTFGASRLVMVGTKG